MAMVKEEQQRSLLKQRGFLGFFYGYLPFLLAGLLLLLMTNHGDVVLWVNRHSNETWDNFVAFLTNFGLGSYVAVVMILLVFIRVEYAVTGLLSLGFTGIFSSLFKKFLFNDQIRPLNYFYYDDFHRFIYVADLNYYFSFPSGHTMGIFSAISFLAFLIGKRWVGFLFFVFALTIGFTRIYLLQHFFLDVYCGSILGVLSAILAVWLVSHQLCLQRFSWFRKPIHRIQFKNFKAAS